MNTFNIEFPSICLRALMDGYRSVCLSVCVSACLSLCLSVCLSVYLLVCTHRFTEQLSIALLLLPTSPPPCTDLSFSSPTAYTIPSRYAIQFQFSFSNFPLSISVSPSTTFAFIPHHSFHVTNLTSSETFHPFFKTSSSTVGFKLLFSHCTRLLAGC